MAKTGQKRENSIKSGETKSERFSRVVKPRVTKAVKAIGVVGYCAGSAYEFTPEQVKQIEVALSKAIVAMLSKFAAKPNKQDGFDFAK